MKNKKLFAAALTAALAVSMMGTSVMAADPTGTTEFSYTPGTSGPSDPIDPSDPENDENNWLIKYPRQIVLTDSNEGTSTASEAATYGHKLTFKVEQKVAGDNGSNVTAGNVGTGIVVAPAAQTGVWESGTDIKMSGTDSSTVMMQLADSTPTKYLSPAETMLTLTDQAAEDDGYAVIKEGQVEQAKDGVTYTTNVKFTFTRGA